MRRKLFNKGIVFTGLFFVIAATCANCNNPSKKTPVTSQTDTAWHAPDSATMAAMPDAALILYGKELIVNTARYLGPKGMVAHMSNGMNCGNCHMDGGTRINGNSFAMVAASYPRPGIRSGKTETVQYRINDCMERSLNGKRLDTLSKEMKAMVAYIQWVGKDVPKATLVKGARIAALPWLSRPASVKNGSAIFASKCITCHSANGYGLLKPDSAGYIYPPVFGSGSYNVSAGMFMLSKLAGFVKYNMPYTAVAQAPVLTDEEAWDVAAFINSQQRPVKMFAGDWPVPSNKPLDYPFGPYADSFSEAQHKYGPFAIMKHSK